MSAIKVVLLDIGGVLVELVGAPKILGWMGGSVAMEELNHKWGNSEAVTRFETGRCEPIHFAEAIVTELKLSVQPDQFLKEFVHFPKDFFPEAKDILKKIVSNYTVASFSNTNSLQWDRLNLDYGIEQLFHNNFLSYQIGLMKPDKQAYEYVVRQLGCEAEEILFFDDSQANVNMGNEIGMKAYKVSGARELLEKLTELNIILEQ
ncbi:HAD-IA family hydrolase [Paenibacillus mesotrionivorans]|uniref:HAD-IA family hydrolase n=1 Tax=Paenibacillus mesotrionivorans TaxID=3160968 RepID=A0ACC7NUP0_9BACL